MHLIYHAFNFTLKNLEPANMTMVTLERFNMDENIELLCANAGTDFIIRTIAS